MFEAVERKTHLEGTHRVRRLQTTFDRLQPLLAGAGITRVANVTGLDTLGVPVVMVTRPASRSLSVVQGKGISLLAAKVSGLMEGLEHWHAEHVERPLRYCTEHALPRGAHRAPGGDTHAARLWIQGVEVQSGAPAWVPFGRVHLDYRVTTPQPDLDVSSNGLASGNTVLEATCHALFEVVERHLAARFYARSVGEQDARRLDLDSLPATARHWIERIDAGGAAVALWDLSDDLGVAAFRCSILERQYDPLRPLPLAHGLGCHADREVALLRAITEAAQSRLTLIVGARDDITRRSLARARSRQRWEWAYLQLKASRCARRLDTVPSHSFSTLNEDLTWLLQQLKRQGHASPLVVDLSKANAPIAVVRVLAPGLLQLPTEATRESSAA